MKSDEDGSPSGPQPPPAVPPRRHTALKAIPIAVSSATSNAPVASPRASHTAAERSSCFSKGQPYSCRSGRGSSGA
jgi:hypothetical protein